MPYTVEGEWRMKEGYLIAMARRDRSRIVLGRGKHHTFWSNTTAGVLRSLKAEDEPVA